MNTQTEESFSSNKIENNIDSTEFIFKSYGLILFNKNGQIIFNSSIIDSDLNNLITSEFLEIYTNIIKKIIIINDASKQKKELLHYYLIKNENLKIEILNIEKTNIYLLGIFNDNVHSSIIKIFLLHILLSFLNYMGEKSCFIIKDIEKLVSQNESSELEKINPYSNKDSIKIKDKDIISTDNMNYFEGNENNDSLYSKIYEYFLLLPSIEFFILITKNIFIRHNFYNKGALYKNFYLVDLDTGQALFSIENIYNLHNGFHPSHNIKLNEKIWKEFLYHGKNLKKNYEQNYGKILDFEDYQEYFIRIELKCTFPRMIYILRFMPLLKGVLLIHEYELKSYSIDEDNDEEYREIDILNGTSISRDNESEIEDDDEILLINEPKFLKEREYFFINFFLSTNSNIKNNFYIKNFQIKYFSSEILNIINKVVNKFSSKYNDLNTENIILDINNELYNEYLQINNIEEKNPILISANKVIYKSINNLKNIYIPKEKEKNIISLESTEEDTNKIINQYQWNSISSPYIKNLFQIEKKFILIILFNYRKDLKKNEVTLELSKFDENYSIIDKDKEDIKNNEENSKNKNDINKNNIKDEDLSEILEDKISEYLESPPIKIDKNNYKDKNIIKQLKNKNIKDNEEIVENNKISDEDKSKDILNIKYDYEKNSLFNLNLTYISSNDIKLLNSFKLEKENNSKNNVIDYKNSDISKISRNSEDQNKNLLEKKNSIISQKNSFNIMAKKQSKDINRKIEENQISNLSNLPNQQSDKSSDEKFRNILKSTKRKNFLDNNFNTVGSSENFYNLENSINKK